MQSRWTFAFLGSGLLLASALGVLLVAAPVQPTPPATPTQAVQQGQLLPVIVSEATAKPHRATPTAQDDQLLPIVVLGAPTLPPVAASPSARAPTAVLEAYFQGTIVVVGEGEVTVKPDFAQAAIGVETFAPTVAEATGTNERVMAAVMAALARSAIAEGDIQTISYAIVPERSYDQKGVGATTGYRVTNMVQVTIRDLARVGVVLERAIGAGANQIFDVSFGLTPQAMQRAEGEARQGAVAALHDHAHALARLNGVRVGTLLAISEEEGTTPWADHIVQGMGGGGGAPVAPGGLIVRVRLRATYRIEG